MDERAIKLGKKLQIFVKMLVWIEKRNYQRLRISKIVKV